MKRKTSKSLLTKMLSVGILLAGAVALNGTAAKAAGDVEIEAVQNMKGVKILSNDVRMPMSISLDQTSLVVTKEQTQKLNVLVDDDADKTVTWSSDNTKVATVDADGNVTFQGVGTAKITAKTVNGKTATCEVTCLVENSKANPFADIKSDDWAFASLKDMLDQEIMVGTGKLADKVVSGCDKVLTRAQFARILYSMEKEPEVEYSEVFSDVPNGEWYSMPIIWANANGLIVGKGSYFDVDAPATREQIATILNRYAEFKGLDVSVADGIDEKIAGFSDKGSISNWAKDGLGWALSHEIVFGKPNSILDPTGKASRAECAAMISRFLNNITSVDVEINETNFPDKVFREYISKNFDQDKNGSLSGTEINHVKEINVGGKILEVKVSDSIIDFSQYESGGVTSVKGIEFFTNLRVLDCSANDIKELDVSKNTALTKLQCSHNKLKVLDLYRNPNLDHLSCAFNDIYYIDIRNCPKLELVNEKGYSISFSGSMAGIFYPGRQYVIKDEKGADIAYYLSADSIIGTSKDPLIDVAIDEVFPDPVFKKYIKDHFDWNGDGRLSSLESGNAGIIDCSGTEAQIGEIKSLEGIRFLPNLDTLKCDHNQISSLDVSRCDRLTKLYCNDNPMTTLKLIDHERDNEYEKEDDVDEDDGYEEEYEYRNYKLKEVFCYNCNLTELDVHNCVCIEYAYIDGEATADQNTYTFSEPEDDAILKIDKGVKIITDEWSSRDDLE